VLRTIFQICSLFFLLFYLAFFEGLALRMDLESPLKTAADLLFDYPTIKSAIPPPTIPNGKAISPSGPKLAATPKPPRAALDEALILDRAFCSTCNSGLAALNPIPIVRRSLPAVDDSNGNCTAVLVAQPPSRKIPASQSKTAGRGVVMGRVDYVPLVAHSKRNEGRLPGGPTSRLSEIRNLPPILHGDAGSSHRGSAVVRAGT
jgi:hypothetical protein